MAWVSSCPLRLIQHTKVPIHGPWSMQRTAPQRCHCGSSGNTRSPNSKSVSGQSLNFLTWNGSIVNVFPALRSCRIPPGIDRSIAVRSEAAIACRRYLGSEPLPAGVSHPSCGSGTMMKVFSFRPVGMHSMAHRRISPAVRRQYDVRRSSIHSELGGQMQITIQFHCEFEQVSCQDRSFFLQCVRLRS